MKHLITATTASLAALALAACDNDVEVDPDDDAIAVAVTDEELYPVGGDLDEAQQEAYDAMDRDAVSAEYDADRIVIEREEREARANAAARNSGASGEGMDDEGSASSDAASGSSDAMADGSSSDQASYPPLPPRGNMTFDYLDRNDDGRLSVAEYAIWALPTKPNPPEPNDEIGPHLTTDEINEAGRTFFYFDEDGNSYLSAEEFTAARASSRTR